MHKIVRFSAIFLLLMLAFSNGCKQEENDSITVIKLGAMLPLSGSGSSPGESIRSALEIAVTDINEYFEAIGSGYKVEIRIEDTESDTAAAIQKYKLLKGQGLPLIIGPCISANVKAVKRLADEDGILIVSPASVANSLSISGDNVFRLVPDVTSQAEAMAAMLTDDSINILIPVVRDDLWGNELLEATLNTFEGSLVEDAVMYSTEITDYQTVVSALEGMLDVALMDHSPEEIGIYLVSYGEGTDILKQASMSNSLASVRWYGNSAFAENKTLLEDFSAAEFAEYTRLACPSFGYNPDARSKWEPLLDQLKIKLGRQPEIYAFAAYDALWLAALACENAGEKPGVAYLKEAITLQSNNYFGVTGWTVLNNAGDRAQAMYDFWGVVRQPGHEWQVLATYNNVTGQLIRF